MDSRPCGVLGCDRPRVYRLYCPTHHRRWKRYGDPGGQIVPQHRGGPWPCVIEGCEKTAATGGGKSMCPMHYQRNRVYGDPGPAEPSRKWHRGEPCAVEWCDEPAKKRDWCELHYGLQLRGKEMRDFKYRWREAGLPCFVCGKSGLMPGSRWYCSSECVYTHKALGGLRETTKTCRVCGETYKLQRREKLQYQNNSVCESCNRYPHKHRASVEMLAERDGTLCQLCGDEVDMTLHGTRPDAPSTDHIIPWSRGGSHDPKNLQLAHFGCNSRKRNRMPTGKV